MFLLLLAWLRYQSLQREIKDVCSKENCRDVHRAKAMEIVTQALYRRFDEARC